MSLSRKQKRERFGPHRKLTETEQKIQDLKRKLVDFDIVFDDGFNCLPLKDRVELDAKYDSLCDELAALEKSQKQIN